MASKSSVKVVQKTVTSTKTHVHLKANVAPAKKAAVQGKGARPAATKAGAVKPVAKVVRVTKRKAYTRPQFRRPHTFRTPREVKPSANTKAVKNRRDDFAIIKHPLTTDTAMNKIEKNNTLTFIVDPRANKTSIKKAIYALYHVKTVKVNTLIRPDGKKKVYARLAAQHDALDVANKINIL